MDGGVFFFHDSSGQIVHSLHAPDDLFIRQVRGDEFIRNFELFFPEGSRARNDDGGDLGQHVGHLAHEFLPGREIYQHTTDLRPLIPEVVAVDPLAVQQRGDLAERGIGLIASRPIDL